MNLYLKGSRVIVTAGANGIGRSIVDGFREAGAQVATCDIDEIALASLPKDIIQQKVDVANSNALKQFIDMAVERLGGLDCLVNNAGVSGPTGRIEDLEVETIEQCISICLTSQFVAIGCAVPYLRSSQNPSIVNISSLAGRLGFKLRSPYAAAKWGVIGLTKSMSIELGPDRIRVNAILPGIVAGDRQRKVLEARAHARDTSFRQMELEAFSFTSIQDYVTPQQIADQVLFLASSRSKTVSGQSISVCGDTGMLG